MTQYFREDELSEDRLHAAIRAGRLRPWRTDRAGRVWFKATKAMCSAALEDEEQDDLEDEEQDDEGEDEQDLVGQVIDRVMALEARVAAIEEIVTTPDGQ